MLNLRTVVCLIGAGLAVTLPSFAASGDSVEDLKKQIAAMNARTKSLQKQLQVMQTNMAQMQFEHTKLIEEESHLAQALNRQQLTKVSGDENDADKVYEDHSIVEDDVPVDLSHEPFTGVPYGHTLLGNLGGTAVITSPYIHSRYDYRGSGLIVNYSSINKDVSALFQRRSFLNQMSSMGYELPNYPILEISGDIEGQFAMYRDFTGRSFNDFDVSNAEIDFQALANDWFTGFVSLTYDSSPNAAGRREANANVGLDNGFITVGNLNKQPYYVTIGQFYVPFGQFDSYLISDPLNKILFRTKARALTLGYQTQASHGPFGSVYAFRGPTRTGPYEPDTDSRSSSSHINTFGINAGYLFEAGALTGMVGASAITNVANSCGMQSPLSADFGGFGESSANEVLRHRVPGYDGRLELYYDAWTFIGEYSSSARSFSPLDLSFNGHGVKPSGYHLEGVWNFDLFKRPSNIAMGYGRSFDSLALGVPSKRMAIAMNTAFWKNTLASLEFHHDVNYDNNDTASGSSGVVFMRPGKVANGITAHFDVYF